MIREINGKEYNFEFTRRVVRDAEKKGFELAEGKPATMAYELWNIGLRKNHPMPSAKSDDLFDDYLDSDDCPESFSDIVESLVNQYSEAFE